MQTVDLKHNLNASLMCCYLSAQVSFEDEGRGWKETQKNRIINNRHD